MFKFWGRSRPCDHPEVTTTHNYGLVRHVCRKCGMVQIEATNGGSRDKAKDRPTADQPVAKSA